MVEDGKIFFCLHAGDYAFHRKQSRNCLKRIPSGLDDVLEIERALYLEPKHGCLGSGHYLQGDPGQATEHLLALVFSPRRD